MPKYEVILSFKVQMDVEAKDEIEAENLARYRISYDIPGSDYDIDDITLVEDK
jgi:hypothetical protein